VWSKLAALALVFALAGRAVAQTESDLAIERLEAIDALWLLKLRPSATLALHSAADGGGLDPAGAGGLGLAIVGLEKRGTAWEALRLDRLQPWSYGGLDLAFTFLDVQQEMIGTDVDHDLCFAALPVIALGDCQHGGVVGLRAQLLHHAHETASARWFHRWFELGAVLSFLGDAFDVDFVDARLPITLGVSLDHVTNAPLPDGEAGLRLRGLAELGLVHRFAGYRHELTASIAFRPALAPFEFGEDYAVEGRVRLAYVWLAALLGSVRSTSQRVYLELRASHWQKPWLAEQPALGENNLSIVLGLELSIRNLTPS
jgi:hypothetical protein